MDAHNSTTNQKI